MRWLVSDGRRFLQNFSGLKPWCGNVATCLLSSYHFCLSFFLLSLAFSCFFPFSYRFRLLKRRTMTKRERALRKKWHEAKTLDWFETEAILWQKMRRFYFFYKVIHLKYWCLSFPEYRQVIRFKSYVASE